MLKSAVMCAMMALSCTVLAAEKPMIIRNDSLEVSYDHVSQRVALRGLRAKTTFIPSGYISGLTGPAKIVSVTDSSFGKGQGIEVSLKSGKCSVELYPKLPFALVKRTAIADPDLGLELSQWDAISAAIDLGKRPSELSLLGTGGWKKASEKVGSYEWMAVAQPGTRKGVVFGWLTQEKATGVIRAEAGEEYVVINASSELGKLSLKPGASCPLDVLAIGYFDDARLGLEAWADAVAKVNKIKLPPIITGYCTWYHARASDEKSIVRDAQIAAEKLKPYGFDFMQIDDGWQDGASKNGPDKNFTRVRPGGPYPGGMKPVADALAARGLMPGIWFMAFSGNWNDPWWADKQDLFYKTKEGKPFEAHWSGTEIDMTNPASQAYVRDEVKRIKDWGYRYFKMDGLHSGTGTKQTYANMWYTDDNFPEARPSDPYKTNIEAHRDGLKLIRDVAGKDVFFLGCAAPQNMRSYGASFGLVDAMRIGPDNGGNWQGWLTSPRASTAHWFMNGRIWYNDPDPVYVRTSVSLDQAKAMCSWQALTGYLTVFSDSIADLPEERIDIIRRMLPTHKATARPVDVLDNDQRRIWLVTDTSKNVRRDVTGLFNWTNDPIDCSYDMAYIGLDPKLRYAAYDYWSGETMILQGKLDLPVSPTSCRVLAVRPLQDHPFLLSTSRHITQGIVDVMEEKWTGGKSGGNKLSGRSLVVANDPYELRIVDRGNGFEWPVLGVAVSAADEAAGVKIEKVSQDGGLARIRIMSPASREVAWALTFSPRSVQRPSIFDGR